MFYMKTKYAPVKPHPKSEKELIEIFNKVKQDLSIKEAEFNEQLKKYEPYDLTEIDKIANEARENSTKSKSHKMKLFYLNSVIDEIDKRINNCKAVYKFLSQKEQLDPSFYEIFTDIEDAEEIKVQVQKRINEIYASQVSINIYDKELWDVDDLAKHRNCSTSKIYKETQRNEIPEELYYKEGNEYNFIKRKIIPWLETGIINNDLPQEIIETSTSKEEKIKSNADNQKIEKKYHLSFKVPLESLANIFVENGYLNKENAKLFVNRLKDCYLTDDSVSQKMEWEKSMKSLMTFILVSDKLGWIDFDKSDRITDYDYDEAFIPMEPFFSNFKIKKKGKSEVTISRRKKEIVDDLDDIIDKTTSFSIKQNIKISIDTDTQLIIILDLFFKNRSVITLKKTRKINEAEGIDMLMLELLWQYHKKYFK